MRKGCVLDAFWMLSSSISIKRSNEGLWITMTIIRNDETTVLALSNLYMLVTHHGQDLEHAALRHLAADLGYTLTELDAAARGKRHEQPFRSVSVSPEALKAASGDGRADSHDEWEHDHARDLAEARGGAVQ